jgi:hypothetical protein
MARFIPQRPSIFLLLASCYQERRGAEAHQYTRIPCAQLTARPQRGQGHLSKATKDTPREAAAMTMATAPSQIAFRVSVFVVSTSIPLP